MNNMMCYITNPENMIFTEINGHLSSIALDKTNGCEGVCVAGISIYSSREYSFPESHDFQEGFYVISGSGKVMIDTVESEISLGTSFFVPKGKKHALKSFREELKVFWFHA